jgi:hypothetical protein
LPPVFRRAATSEADSGESGRGRKQRKPFGVAPAEKTGAPRLTPQEDGESANVPTQQQSSRLRRSTANEDPKMFANEVDAHISKIQKRSRRVFEDQPDGNKFQLNWRKAEGHKPGLHARYRLQEPPPRPPRAQEGEEVDAEAEKKEAQRLRNEHGKQPYSDYAGLRFPTLETAESYNYHQDTGLDRLVERSFPIVVPKHRRLDPYLREYIHFLHRLDPARFTLSRIAERYRLRESTVKKVVQECSVNRWLATSGLTSLREKQVTKEDVILEKKEQMYAKWVGYDQLGDEEDAESDEEELGEIKGWRPTSDWVRQQKIEVEMMSAFPMMEKRDPMPKRVDVDMTVGTHRGHKVINWLDPTDKVVF